MSRRNALATIAGALLAPLLPWKRREKETYEPVE